MYAKLVRGPKVRFAKALWAARVQLKVCILVWQATDDKLPSAINLQKRHNPVNGCRSLCGAPQDVNHIIFQCAPAQFLWSCLHNSFGASWNPRTMKIILLILAIVRGNTAI